VVALVVIIVAPVLMFAQALAIASAAALANAQLAVVARDDPQAASGERDGERRYEDRSTSHRPRAYAKNLVPAAARSCRIRGLLLSCDGMVFSLVMLFGNVKLSLLQLSVGGEIGSWSV
jgi:hypothetical protein